MKTFRIEIKWSIIFVLMQLVWMLLERISGLHDKNIEMHVIVTNFIAIPSIAIYVFAFLDKRKNYYSGSLSYKQGIITGLIMTLIITVLSPLVQYITSTFITPQYFANAIKYAVETGKMSLAEAETNFNLKSYIQQVLIGTPLMGIVTAAIVAIFTRRTTAK